MIQDSVNKVIYNGNGAATEFFYPFKITKHTDVKVMTVSPDGAETVLTNNYYVDEERSTVVYPGWVAGEEPGNQGAFAPLDDGWKLVIYRQADYTQEVGLLEQYPYKTIEAMVDKQTILIQQLKDTTDRAMTVSVAVDVTDVDMRIPHAAGKTFRWSDDGKRLEATDDPAYLRKDMEAMSSQMAVQSELVKRCADEAVEAASKATKAADESQKANQEVKENAEQVSQDLASLKEQIVDAMSMIQTETAKATTAATKASKSETASYTSSLNASQSATQAEESASNADANAVKAEAYAKQAERSASISATSSDEAEAYAKQAKQYANSASQGQFQADYNETDTTSKAYIKNIPRYVVVSTRTRGEDEPTYDITPAELLISDGTIASDTDNLVVNVEGTNYKISDQYTIERKD